MQPVRVVWKPERQPTARSSHGLMEARRPVVTMILIGVNVAVFVAMVVSGISATDPDVDQLLAIGANRGTLVVFQHQWWRTFTNVFIHIGVLHLAVNMYSLWGIGGFVERMLKAPMFLLVYLLCGLGGSFASVLWNPASVSAGASGAIVGLFGFVIGFAIQARPLLPPDAVKSLWSGIVATLALNVFLAFSVPYLDNAAHLGGLVVGILSGFVGTASAIERQGRGASFGSQVIVIAAVIGLGVLAMVRTENNPNALTAEAMLKAQAAFQKHDLAEVEKQTTVVLEKKQEPVAFLLRSLARNERGDRDGGLDDANAAIALLTGTDHSALLAEVYALRSGVHQVAERFVEAEADISRANLIRPDPGYVGLRGYSRLRLGDVDGGLQDAYASLANPAASSMVLNNLAWGALVTGQDLELALKLVDESIERDATSAAAKSTRCWIRVARNEPDLGLADCVAAVASANELMDRGMVAFIQNRPEEAIPLWEEAAKHSPLDAKDLAPWLAKARAQLPVEDDAGVP